MKTFAKRSMSALLVLVMLVSALSALSVTAFAKGGKNQGVRHQTCTALSSQAQSYYTGNYTYDNLSALEGGNESCLQSVSSPLYQQLYKLMSSTMTDHVSYHSLPEYWKDTDATGGSNSYVLFYSDIVSGGCNREHVWPKSQGSFHEEKAGCDLHHLRPADTSINSTRSHYTMGNVRKNCSTYKTAANGGHDVLWYNGSYSKDQALGLVEVNDNIKGDVARIFLYVYCRWQEPNLFEQHPDPHEGSNVKSASRSTKRNDGCKVIENLDTLLEWCEMDPVDDWEMGRNDKVQDVQGNRNVFIDYPEFAWLLFGQDIPSDMKTPSGEAQNAKPAFTLTAVSSNDAWGTVSVHGRRITAEPAEGYYAAGYEVLSGDATVSQNGNSFTVEAEKGSTVKVQINFAAKKKVTVSFAGAEGVAPKTGYAGEEMTLPTATAPEGYAFVGWTKDVLAEDSTEKPEYLTGTYTPTDNTVLHALYYYLKDNEDGGTGDYVKVKTAPTDWSGEYVIVYETDSKVFDTSLEELDAPNNTQSVTIENDTISAAEGDPRKVTLANFGTGYSVQCTNGKYLDHDSGNSVTCTSNPVANEISLAGGNVKISKGDYTLKFNASNGQKRFRYYGGGQEDISIYAKDGSGSTRYYTSDAGIVSTFVFAAVSNNEEFGTVKQDGNVITATPKEGYVVKDFTVDPEGAAVVAQDGNVFTVSSLTANCTITINFVKSEGTEEKEPVDSFTDCPDTWYRDAVNYAVENKLMGGIGNNQFAPQDNLTRGMIVEVLYRNAGTPEVTELSTFTDVPETAWYAKAVAWAEDNEVVNGVGDGLFAPEDKVTRDQIATILYRYKKPENVEDADFSGFSDADLIEDYAVDAMNWAVSCGLLKGDKGMLKPLDTATRAEFATMIMRFLEK